MNKILSNPNKRVGKMWKWDMFNVNDQIFRLEEWARRWKFNNKVTKFTKKKSLVRSSWVLILQQDHANLIDNQKSFIGFWVLWRMWCEWSCQDWYWPDSKRTFKRRVWRKASSCTSWNSSGVLHWEIQNVWNANISY